ncbi:MAG: type 1 glutamine amidotransferase [Raineya sp.]|nr:type 1 glutamine amidotransferase [Raineya sp.]
MRIHCFQHVSFEGLGYIADWAKENNHQISYTYFFEKNFQIPSIENIDILIVLGGYMNVDEEEKFEWLKPEKEFIKRAIDAQKKVMGICLGSQLISSALGCRVYANENKEIGFFPVSFAQEILQNQIFNHLKKEILVFQWHGDTFDMPSQAVRIASSNVCKDQGYIIDNQVLALQFHWEMNETILKEMLIHDGNELEEKGICIQSKEKIKEMMPVLEQNKHDFFQLLDKFFL